MDQKPAILSDKSSTEDKTTLSSVDASDKDKKLKKWTPPGYIRTVNKQIIKQPKDLKPTIQSDQANEGVFDGVRSILELLNISEEQQE